MGDFYELFFEDAEIASRALGITLTKRGKHLGQDIPMCGVPVHAADDYLQKLIAKGSASRSANSRGSGGSQEARLEIGGAARRDAAGDARHDHRGKLLDPSRASF
jgi:DNA mismatch repair ATPase MutS